MKTISGIEQLVEEYRSLHLAKNYLKKLEKKLNEERLRLVELGNVLEEEYMDVRDYEELTLHGLFLRSLKNSEEQYEIEKQEYLLAAIQFNECKNLVELLEFEQRVLEEKLEKEKEIETRLSQMINDREAAIAKKYPQAKNLLLNISSQIDQKLAFKRELHEAVIVGLKLHEVLEKMKGYLTKARGHVSWGKFPEGAAENLYRDRSLVDKAQQLSYKAKQLLLELKDELKDVYSNQTIARVSKFEEFHHFNDIYYDRLISDWVIQKNLVTSITCLTGTQDNVRRIVEALKVEQVKTERSLEYLDKRRKEVILDGMTDDKSQ